MIPYKWLALIIVSIHAFMGTLDLSIAYLSFPILTKVFNTEPSIVLWVSLGYLLTSTGLMLICGRIGDAYGMKRVFVLGFSILTIGLVLGSLSLSIFQLIFSRVIQGIGAAMTISVGPAIIAAAFPDEERGKALGMMGAVLSAGILCGPVFGGFLLDTLGWRSIFYTRVPIGAIGTFMSWFILREQRRSIRNVTFDMWGASTLFPTFVCMLLFFYFGGRYGFSSMRVLILGGSVVVLLVLFILRERRTAQPLVDLRLFRIPSFTLAILSLGILTLAASAQVLLVPFYMIDGVGYSASKTGLLLAIASVIGLVVGPLSGWLSDKIGPRFLCTTGVATVSLSLFLLSRLGIESSSNHILTGLALFGVGWFMFFSPNNSAVMGSVPREQLSIASAMLATTRQTGTSFGLAIAGAIFTSRQAFHAAQLISDNMDSLKLERLSLIGGFKDTLLITALICCIGIYTSYKRGT